MHEHYTLFHSGILAFVKPCGIVIDLKELYGSESKSQVYGHLHDVLSLPGNKDISKLFRQTLWEEK